MSRYSPTVTPYYGDNYGDILADGLQTYIQGRRQEKADSRADETYNYEKGRRERLDPLEEALLRAQLYDRGVVPSDGDDTPDSDPAGSLSSGIQGQRQAPMVGRGGLTGRTSGMFAPGSFNPVTGTFNPAIDTDPGFAAPRLPGGRQVDTDPGFTAPHGHDRFPSDPGIDPGFAAPGQRGQRGHPGRVPLGGGYELDESRTPQGRTEARQRRMIDAMVARGVPRDEAEVEVLGGLESSISEHFHPGTWHPKTMADALDYEKQLIHERGNEEVRVAGVRDRHSRKDTDPAWEERRRGWIKRLGGNEPTNRLQQDILDGLADGDEPNDILDQVPRGQRSEAERYLGRAVRQRGREMRPPLGSEPSK